MAQPGPIRFCFFCHKPFLKGRDQVADGQPSKNNPLAFSPASSTTGDFTLNDLFASSSATDTDKVRVDIDWDALGFAAADMVPEAPKSNLPRFHEPAPKVMSNGTFLLDNPDGRHVIDAFHASFDSEKLAPTRIPWSAWTTRYDYLPALFGPVCLLERPDSEFLARLPILDPVSQFTATLVMQMLRAFPQMMLRRETLPSFIHGHWYRPLGVTELSLPEPLVNCMGIAQIFASQNLESKPFLWRTVQMEQRSFLEKHHQFSRDDLLAAIQAQIMYIIMRVIDNSKIEQDLNLEMLVTHQVLCDSFRALCNEPFCQDERLYPSSCWEDWVFAESRRRTVLVWFLIAQTVRIKTGVPCDTLNGFRALPLSSPKSLWEARTRSAWQLEYEGYKSMQRMSMDVFGDLIDACKESDVGSSKTLRLDTWNANADNLGILLSLGAAMI
ncbi:hypothetical protein V493_04730 [Pseudogymnoascus sp. VKM F-4281 (FW-2241)]|nr:hypothetical protein V493_04730 [Pseudogymnoascus sp. VKM F-4281 (FW-2241)]